MRARLTGQLVQEQTIKEIQEQAEAWQRNLQQALDRLEAASAIDTQAAPAQQPADLG